VDPRGEFAFLIPVIIDLAVAYSAYVALHDPLEKLGHALENWWNNDSSTWDVPAYDENGAGVCYSAEHTKNKRKSTKGKHEKGQKRKKQKYKDKKRNKPEWQPRK